MYFINRMSDDKKDEIKTQSADLEKKNEGEYVSLQQNPHQGDYKVSLTHSDGAF